LISIASIAAALIITTGVALAAIDGTITSLSATDAPDFNQTITINAAFLANANINNSNVYYEIIAPDGVTVVATHTTSMPSMNGGDAFSDSWTTTNSSFPSSGTYTLRACWSEGNSTHCQIDSASTSFFSVPTTGMWLALVGAVLLGLFLWRRRSDFRIGSAKSPRQSSANSAQPSK
jgi:hypothetical protein